jgi:hypothetical protein
MYCFRNKDWVFANDASETILVLEALRKRIPRATQIQYTQGAQKQTGRKC